MGAMASKKLSVPQNVVEYNRQLLLSWGVPHALVTSKDPMEIQQLRTVLEKTDVRHQSAYTYTPDSFCAEDDGMQVIPRKVKWEWSSLEKLICNTNLRGLLFALPTFWQLEPAAKRASRKAGLPIFVAIPSNIPVLAASINYAEMDTVIAEPQTAIQLGLFLAERNLKFPKMWVLIQQASASSFAPPISLPETSRVTQEVHLFPGFPILFQCDHLSRAVSPLFHPETAYFFESDDRGTYITSTADPFPFLQLRLPFQLQQAGMECLCGNTVMEIL
jgi:hypothetical protein